MQTEEQMGGKSVDWGVREEHRVCVCAIVMKQIQPYE